MSEREIEEASTTGALPVAPSLGPALAATPGAEKQGAVDRRVVAISAAAVVIAFAAAVVAQVLTRLIGLITNISFYGRVAASFVSPAEHHLGWLVIFVPILGGVIVGIMARYGSEAIRGHGIPEAMEQILYNRSKIAPRVMFLKPISAAISIGTGGPFGAEGPIIATGGALGSVIGQLFPVTADERKTLLSSGAAAGMAATFGSPVSAVLLAIELLLFELRPRSIIPVALACATAAAARVAMVGNAPVFPMPDIVQPTGTALAVYAGIGAIVGLASVLVTRVVYGIEDAFEKLPVHWMWWPAIGAIAVGVCGYFVPRTMGVGYDNIESIVSGHLVGRAMIVLCVVKLVSWAISLGSGTSGGTLAPLFTIGGGLGSALAAGAIMLFPGLGMDVRVGALVGMAAMFAGASRALLTSLVFAFETTRQPIGLLPLLAGCSAAYLFSCLWMRHSIMTEKIARRGTKIAGEYGMDALEQSIVKDWATTEVVTIPAKRSLDEARAWLVSKPELVAHHGFPVVDDAGRVIGVVTRRDLLDPTQPSDMTVVQVVKAAPITIPPDATLREAADAMARHGVGRLVVAVPDSPEKMLGILTRADILEAHGAFLEAHEHAEKAELRQLIMPLGRGRRGPKVISES